RIRFARALIASDTCPVECLRCSFAIRMLACRRFELTLRGIKLTAAERCLGQPKLQVCYKVICGQKPLEPVPLRAVRLGNNHRWRPLGFETLEILRPFFDVD